MPPPNRLALDLRSATLDDVPIVADVEATRDPDDPRDPEMMRFWWTSGSLIELGYKRVRTANDGANAPILHINQEMGYRVVTPVIELHRSLT
jgi:hypothetical protein